MVLCVGLCSAQTIRNTNNSVVAKIDNDGTVRNSNNSVIARINSNGDIRDSNNRDGTVRDSNNHTIGYAKGVPSRYAALYFFFNFF